MFKKTFAFNLFANLCLLVLTAFSATVQTKSAAYLTEPSISPDRREIAFVSGGDIWTVPAAGGTASLLVAHPANESRPVYSPDGRQLAFASARTGNGDVYVLNFETGDLRRVTFDDAAETLDAWSPNGEWLYFSSTSREISGMSDVYRVRASGGTPMQVSNDRYTSEFQAAPAPDGNSVAFTARGIGNSQWWRKGRSHIDESEIWLKTGDRYEQLADRGAKQMWTMWSADGKRIFYVSDRTGAQNVWTKPVGTAGQARQLTDFKDGRVLWANISADGKQIVFERNFRIWTLATDGGKASEVAVTLRGATAAPLVERISLAGQIRELALAPDGRKAAVVARGEIFAASAKDGGDTQRVTNTVAPESFVAWSPDSRRIVYTSERGGKSTIFQYDFAAETETQLTTTGNDFAPVFSPDGKSLAFFRDARRLMIYDLASKREREVCRLFTDAPPLAGKRSLVWSPDNRWIAFLANQPESRSYTNVYVVSASGTMPQPVSFLANSNSSSVSWSTDGSFVLFDTSQRTEEGVIARVDLNLRTPRFREDQFRDLFRQENPQQRPQPTPTTSPTATPQTSPSPQTTPAASPSPSPAESKTTEIVFDGIRRRLSLLQTGIDAAGQTISPDGKTLLVLATSEGQFNLYTYPLDELATDVSAKQLTSTPAFKSDAQFSPDGKEVYYLENGRVNVVALDRREVRPVNLNLDLSVNFAEEKMEIFRQGWRFMRDNFYDEKFHGADWNRVRETYEPLVQAARTADEMRRLMNMMVGELNASHLGVNAPPNPANQATPVGKLGLRFDRAEYETNGRLKITEIIALSPAAVSNEIKVGDYLISVDGTEIGGAKNLDELLENKVGRRVELEISASPDAANKREVIVKPVNTQTEKLLLYRQWVEANRAYVERVSGGKFGYVHLPDMSANSLQQLYVDLDAQNQAKDAVVIDVRNNQGGFVNPYVIDVFARRGYLNMSERGFWQVPARSALGQRSLERPTILITNQHSLSDAEDFAEGYRTLKLGKIVGEPTASWIIFTWNVNLFDGTVFRLPRQLITDNAGKNMELTPRPVDVPATRPIGESLTGKDSQLDRAVLELQRQLAGN